MRSVRQPVMIHILVAILLSLVINFSYLLMPIITENGVGERKLSAVPAGEHTSGVLHLDSDMHGYIVCDCEKRDSVYVSAWQVFNYKLKEADHVTFTTRAPVAFVVSTAMRAELPLSAGCCAWYDGSAMWPVISDGRPASERAL